MRDKLALSACLCSKNSLMGSAVVTKSRFKSLQSMVTLANQRSLRLAADLSCLSTARLATLCRIEKQTQGWLKCLTSPASRTHSCRSKSLASHDLISYSGAAKAKVSLTTWLSLQSRLETCLWTESKRLKCRTKPLVTPSCVVSGSTMATGTTQSSTNLRKEPGVLNRLLGFKKSRFPCFSASALSAFEATRVAKSKASMVTGAI